MSHHRDGHHDDAEHAGGEREGFLDKVKDFFTGGDEHGRDAAPEERELDAEQDDLAEGQSETDSIASAGSGGGGVSESGWDGSDEPPELTVPQNEAVAAYSEAPQEDDRAAAASAETGGAGADDLAGAEGAEPLEDTGNAAVADYSDASGDDVAGESAESTSLSTSGSASAEGDEDYESRHGSGVDDSGVLADAPRETRDDETAERETRAADPAETSDDGSGEEETREEEERARREEEFAREHDPTTHDIEAGEEFRQRGDWTAAEHDGPQVQESDGTVRDPDDDASGASEPTAEPEAGEGEASRPDEGGSDVAALTGAEGIEDGGHGWGSAAPMPGGGTPLGHPVKAWHDTMTFVLPGEDGYEGSDPHEWFVDAETAQRAGFRHAHGG